MKKKKKQDLDFNVVRVLRKRTGLTMEQLAAKAGLTYPTVAAIETNKTAPSMQSLTAIAGVLETKASEILAMAEGSSPIKSCERKEECLFEQFMEEYAEKYLEAKKKKEQKTG